MVIISFKLFALFVVVNYIPCEADKMNYLEACQNNPLSLSCDRGYVIECVRKKNAAIKGLICLDPKKENSKSVKCLNEYDTAVELCNYKRKCIVYFKNKVLGEKCPIITTSFSVLYKCIPRPKITYRKKILRHNTKGNLKCKNGKIVVVDAYYGNGQHRTVCSDAAVVAKKKCNGKVSRCTLVVHVSRGFWEPNPYAILYSYLTVDYKCLTAMLPKIGYLYD